MNVKNSKTVPTNTQNFALVSIRQREVSIYPFQPSIHRIKKLPKPSLRHG